MKKGVGLRERIKMDMVKSHMLPRTRKTKTMARKKVYFRVNFRELNEHAMEKGIRWHCLMRKRG